MEHVLPSGQVFAERYRIERVLARGGFGVVYVAEQLATEAHVALKVLWPHILGSEAAVTSFQQEARIAGRVRSEHIVRVLDAGYDDATQMPFLVMELLHGQDLQRMVEQSGPLSAELTVILMRQVASGLDKAHGYVDRDGVARPIVHRDLKPENLFMSQRESGDAMVKVLDFGIAKVMSATAKVSREVKGTPLYMAYEQASSGAITPQTDIWALGLIVFFLLTGRSYWRAAQSDEGSLTQLFGEVLSLPIVPPSQRLVELGVQPFLPPAFDDWFLRCVHRDPSQRFASAGKAVAALGEALGVAVAPSSAFQQSGALPGPGSGPHGMATPLTASAPTVAGQSNPGDFAPTLQSARGSTQQGLSVSGPAVPVKKTPVLPFVVGGALLLVVLGVGLLFVVKAAMGGGASAEPAAPVASATMPETPPPPAAPEVAPTAAPPASTAAPVGSAEPSKPSTPATKTPDPGTKAPAAKTAGGKPADPMSSAPSAGTAKGGKDESLYGER
jgi:serine/threonine-protein kinase